ncbi:MAG: hypothetical protein ACK49R_05065, partial [Planctomycetota bacterium]
MIDDAFKATWRRQFTPIQHPHLPLLATLMETADKLDAARGFIEPLSNGTETEREHGMFVGNLAIRYAMTMLDHFGLGDGDDYPLPIHLDQAKNALTNLVSVIQENIQLGQMAVGGLNEEAEAVQGIGVAPRRDATADADSAKQPKRSDAPDEYEANLLVKKFLDGHSKATGRISGLDAWRREMAQRKATKPPPKKSERQLTGEMLAVRGTGDDNDDPANRVMEDDAIWNWLLDKAKPQERADLHMKTPKE